MKINTNTRDYLVADCVPWVTAVGLYFAFSVVVSPAVYVVAGGGLLGLLTWVVGGAAVMVLICIFAERQQLILDGPSGQIVFRRRNLMRHSEEILPLEKFLRAETECRIVRSKTYRTVLVMQGPGSHIEVLHPLGEIFKAGSRAARLAQVINGWVQARAV